MHFIDNEVWTMKKKIMELKLDHVLLSFNNWDTDHSRNKIFHGLKIFTWKFWWLGMLPTKKNENVEGENVELITSICLYKYIQINKVIRWSINLLLYVLPGIYGFFQTMPFCMLSFFCNIWVVGKRFIAPLLVFAGER